MKQFPIMIGYRGTQGPCPSSIPWDAIAPYEGQAQNNHCQSLEHLASRGGLGPEEAYAVMNGMSIMEMFNIDGGKACAFLNEIVVGRKAIRNAVLEEAEEAISHMPSPSLSEDPDQIGHATIWNAIEVIRKLKVT